MSVGWRAPLWSAGALFLCLDVGMAPPATAQEALSGHDSADASTTMTTVRFETTQGTWMNVDVSPDGRLIVFDLLGDLYTIPIAGGRATRLTSGPAFDAEPVFSPDGQRIAFVSDRSGSDNVWLVDADGRHVQSFTTESTTAVSGPEWIASEDFRLAVWKGDEYWLYLADGRGAALRSLLRPGTHLGTGDAAWSRDGRFLYMPDGRSIRRVDVARGISEVVSQRGPAGFRPMASPDGKWLVFASQLKNRTGLRLLDLATLEQRWLRYPLPDRDNSMLEGRTVSALPRFAFTPDSRAIILATGGTLQRLELRSGRMQPIRFRATVEQALRPRVTPTHQLHRGRDSIRTIRDAQRGRAGRRIVFTALGQIWIREGDTPARPLLQHALPPVTLQREPALSPDGQSVAFVTWHDTAGGQLWRVPVTGGAPQQLTARPGVYRHPVWSPDGSTLAVVREEESRQRSRAAYVGANLYVLPATGGPLRRVTASQADDVPAFSPDGQAVYVVARPTGAAGEVSVPTLLAVALRTSEIDTVATLPAATEQVAVAPDGQTLAYTVDAAVYTATLLPLRGVPPGPVRVTETGGLWPATRVVEDGGLDLRWEADSRTLSWVHEGALVRLDITHAAAAPEMIPLTFPVPRHPATGALALEGATVITMRGDEVLRDAIVLVTDGRIAAVGPRDSVALPVGVHRVDVTGTTIIPGLIDLRGVVPLARDRLEGTNPSLAASLAFGVTTVRTFAPGDVVPEVALGVAGGYAELLETGAMTGARLVAEGAVNPVDAGELSSLEAARALVRRQQMLGVSALAQRAPLLRRQRQWLATATREAGLPLIGESGTLRHALTLVFDGYHTIQGTIPNAQLYADVRHLLAAAQTVYVPTLLAATGGRRGERSSVGTAEEYFLATTEIRTDPKLRRFGLDQLGGITWRVREDYHFLAVGRQAARLAAGSVPVAVGTAGVRPGLGVHWEMWALELGGFSAHAALRAATANAAEALGLGRELGTVEVGKVADLVVLAADPLVDLRQSRAARYVMKHGELFDATTLARVWPDATPPLVVRATRYDPPTTSSQDVARTLEATR